MPAGYSSDANQLANMRMLTAGPLPPGIWSTLIAIVRGLTILPGPGYRVKRMGNGVSLEILAPPPPGPSGGQSSYSFRLKKVIIGTNAYVQINGGDGALASLSPTDGSVTGTACVNGNPTDMKTGSPGAYPLLSIDGNGNVYVMTWINGDYQVQAGGSAGGTGVDVLFTSGPVPGSDPAVAPATPMYLTHILGSISNWTVDPTTSVPDFDLNDNNVPAGLTTVCYGGRIT